MNEVLEQAYSLRDELKPAAARSRIEANAIGIFKPPEQTPMEDFLSLAEKIVAVEEAKEQLRIAEAKLNSHVSDRCRELYGQ